MTGTIEHSPITVWTCDACGRLIEGTICIACGDRGTSEVEVVPASQLAGAVDALIHDPTGTVLTLTDREGRAILADLLEDDDLSPALRALRDQLSEWVDPA